MVKYQKTKISLLTFLLLIISSFVNGQEVVRVKITNIESSRLTNNMQNNISSVLTTINTAYKNNKTPIFNKSNITSQGIESILALWEIWGHFKSAELKMTKKGLHTLYGYKLRNITMNVFPENGNIETHDFVFSFNEEGEIIDFNLALESHQYQKMINTSKGNNVTDFRKRELLVETLEQFRTAYNRKDINFLKKIYSKDALIITGTVISKSPVDGITFSDSKQVYYQEQTKNQYINNLTKVFANNEYLNIIFEEVNVEQHSTIKDIYGVTLIQHWNSNTYSDTGWLFLLFDFKDVDKPIIHVRTWQSTEVVDQDGPFQLGSFDIIN